METEGRGIAFVYDDRKRIVRAFASSGSEVQYRYDDRGRIVHVVWSDGTVRDYAYAAARPDDQHLNRIRGTHGDGP